MDEHYVMNHTFYPYSCMQGSRAFVSGLQLTSKWDSVSLLLIYSVVFQNPQHVHVSLSFFEALNMFCCHNKLTDIFMVYKTVIKDSKNPVKKGDMQLVLVHHIKTFRMNVYEFRPHCQLSED